MELASPFRLDTVGQLNAETANEFEFGPIFEFGLGKFLLTTNTFFSREMGELRRPMA